MKTIQPIKTIKKMLLGACSHEVTVRKIGDGWNCRVFVNGELNQEARVFLKEDIGIACRDMLRWEDKCGNISQFAGAARDRIKNSSSVRC